MDAGAAALKHPLPTLASAAVAFQQHVELVYARGGNRSCFDGAADGIGGLGCLKENLCLILLAAVGVLRVR